MGWSGWEEFRNLTPKDRWAIKTPPYDASVERPLKMPPCDGSVEIGRENGTYDASAVQNPQPFQIASSTLPHRSRTIGARLFGNKLRPQSGQTPQNPTMPVRQKYDAKKVRNSWRVEFISWLVC